MFAHYVLTFTSAVVTILHKFCLHAFFDLREHPLLLTYQRALVPVHYLTITHIIAIVYLLH